MIAVKSLSMAVLAIPVVKYTMFSKLPIANPQISEHTKNTWKDLFLEDRKNKNAILIDSSINPLMKIFLIRIPESVDGMIKKFDEMKNWIAAIGITARNPRMTETRTEEIFSLEKMNLKTVITSSRGIKQRIMWNVMSIIMP